MSNRYFKAVFVLVLTFVSTIATMIVLYGVLFFLLGKASHIEGLVVFILTPVLAGILLRRLAEFFLFDKQDKAELQVLGGIRIGDTFQATLTGKGATWPFAKLSASESTLRLQTPFGDYAWQRTDPRLVIRKTWQGHWKVGPDDFGLTGSIFFAPAYWQSGSIERKLKDLGYRL